MDDSGLSYDHWQFENPHKAWRADISYVDYSRMQTQHRKETRHRRWIPEFASSNEKLALVLMAAALRYSRHRMPSKRQEKFETLLVNKDVAALRKLTASRTARIKKRASRLKGIQRDMVLEHVRNVESAGGYLQFLGRVAWLSWRCGFESPAVAETMSCTPVKVRQVLARLVRAARDLGLQTFRQHHSKGTRKNRGRPSR